MRAVFGVVLASLFAAAAQAQSIQGGSNNGPVLLQTITTASSQTSVDFQNIPGGYNHLVIEGNARSQASAGQDTVFIRFNNDSAGDYDQAQVSSTNNANPTGGGATGQTQIATVLAPAANATASYAAAVTINIPAYSGTTFIKSVNAISAGRNTSATPTFWSSGGGDWNSTAAITRVTIIFGASAAFANGLVWSLYGYP